METESDDLGASYRPPRVIVVPASLPARSIGDGSNACKSCGSPTATNRMPRSPPLPALRRSADPCNYLMRGGARAGERAAEEQLARMSKAAMQDLRHANSTLAGELLRLQACGGEERQALREEVAKLQLLVQAQSEKLNSLQAQLADAEQRGNAADGKHRARLREVARRLQAEHGTRLAALQEANDQLLAELAGQQEAMVQLPAAREELCATKARLEAEAAGHAMLRRRCAAQVEELANARTATAAANKRAEISEQQLGDAMRAAAAAVQQADRAEQRLEASEQHLQAERVAHGALQAEAAAEKGHAAGLRGEVERLRRELAAAVQRADATEAERRQLATTLTQRDVAGEGERRELRAALIQAREAEEAAVVRVRAAEARAAQLDHDLTAARREAQGAEAGLREQAAAREERLAASAASRLAALQSELDARGASADDAEAAAVELRSEVVQLNRQVLALQRAGEATLERLTAAEDRERRLITRVDELQQQLEAERSAGRQRDAELSAGRAAAAEMQEERRRLDSTMAAWRTRAQGLQNELECCSEQAAADAKSHAQQLAALQQDLEARMTELEAARRAAASSEERGATAAKRSSALLAQWQQRDAGSIAELTSVRNKLSELTQAHEAMRAEADAAKALVRRRDDELAAATLALSDEQARLAAVRAQLATAERERAAEAEARARATRELNSALQTEQQARLDAQSELLRARKQQAAAEAQLQQQRIAALTQVLDAKAEEAAATVAAVAPGSPTGPASAPLLDGGASSRRSKLYRYSGEEGASSTTRATGTHTGDAALTEYEAWLAGLLAQRGSAAGPHAAAGAALGSSADLQRPRPAVSAASPRIIVPPVSTTNTGASAGAGAGAAGAGSVRRSSIVSRQGVVSPTLPAAVGPPPSPARGGGGGGGGGSGTSTSPTPPTRYDRLSVLLEARASAAAAAAEGMRHSASAHTLLNSPGRASVAAASPRLSSPTALLRPAFRA